MRFWLWLFMLLDRVLHRQRPEPQPIAPCPACHTDLVSNTKATHWPRDGYYLLDCPCGETSKWNFDPPRAAGDPAVPMCLASWRTMPQARPKHGLRVVH